VRAANTGVSALIDDRGRVRAQTRIFERDLVVGDVLLPDRETSASGYATRGDVFAYACTVATVLASLVAFFRGRKHS
jgi:apolipoprotein N-acyltransferase